jgi:hypothetical protein
MDVPCPHMNAALVVFDFQVPQRRIEAGNRLIEVAKRCVTEGRANGAAPLIRPIAEQAPISLHREQNRS